MSTEFRTFFEALLDELHADGFRVESDKEEKGSRIVNFQRYQITVTVISHPNSENIDFDIYADLKAGLYEIGDVHLLLRKMLSAKKICLSYNGREMNTTERLYPQDRQGDQTQTSGL